MKLTFLGSSHGVPAPDRYCSSLMIEVGESVYLLDAGTSIIDGVLRHGKTMADVKAVFTTHAHGDHINGLLPFMDLLNWYYRTCAVDIYMTEQGVSEALTGVLAAIHGNPYDSDRIRMHIAAPGVVWDDGILRVTYLPTRHMEPRPSYAILLEAEGKRVLVTGDMSQKLAKADFPTEAAASGVDVLISEMAHFGVGELAPYLAQTKADRAWITHVYPFHKFDDIAAIGDRYGYPVYIAHDEDVIEI